MKNKKDFFPEGIKRTKPREAVFAVLRGAERPLGAQEIYSLLGESGEIWLSTVYRVLEHFVEKDVAIKSSPLSDQPAVYELNRYGHRHYAVCVSCRRFIPMENCPLAAFRPMLSDNKFRVIGHNLELFGFCAECQKNQEKPAGSGRK